MHPGILEVDVHLDRQLIVHVDFVTKNLVMFGEAPYAGLWIFIFFNYNFAKSEFK